MRKLKIGTLLLISILAVGEYCAQSPQTPKPKPLWSVEFIKVKPGMLEPSMTYLDENWIRVRQEAQREGVVLNYYRLAEEGTTKSDWDILLMTEFKNQTVYDTREKLFDSIMKRLPRNTSGVISGYRKEDLFKSVNSRELQDLSQSGIPEFRLLSER